MPVSTQLCRAAFDGAVLILQNPHFCRIYRLCDEQLVLESQNCFFQAQSLENQPQVDAPHFSVRPELSPVGAPFLAVSLQTKRAKYEFRIWDEIAGLSYRVTGRQSDLENENSPQEISTGVEGDEAKTATSRDEILERFELPMQPFVLTSADFRAQTDHYAELLHESEWFLHPNEADLRLSGNAFAIENTLEKSGWVFFKHAPLPAERPISTAYDLRIQNGKTVGFDDSGEWCATLFFQNGLVGRCAAIQNYSRALRAYHPARDGLFLTNTWGDRSRDAHLSPQFMEREIEGAARLGADIVQIDDGWQRGVTANSALSNGSGAWNGFWNSDPQFWTQNFARFPDGLAPLIALARERKMKFGLWFAPDSAEETKNWERDADAILELHRDLGVDFIKIDALKIETATGMNNSRRFFDKVLRESEGNVTFDLDITAEKRFGPLGLIEPGPLFVENRYTDWTRYFPHHTLRVGWQLAHWIDPVRLRLEWLNNARNADFYGDHPLAPAHWNPETLFAITMFFAPLGWFEIQNLPASYLERAAPLIAIWKQHRETLQNGTIVPIGKAPDGEAWTGLVSIAENGGYALIFRELNAQSRWEIEIPGIQDGETEILGGNGAARFENGRLQVEIGEKLGFLWLRF